VVAGSRQPSHPYIPDRGDLIWLSFDPQAGREQAGRRPALVLSPSLYNGRTRLALVCPITSQVKGYPFEVQLPPGLPVSGVVLADHLRSIDWQARRADPAGIAPPAVVDEVLARLAPLLGIQLRTVSRRSLR
jgi:mRNA interferase MazF